MMAYKGSTFAKQSLILYRDGLRTRHITNTTIRRRVNGGYWPKVSVPT
jgi:hypothetical protein